MGLIPSYQSLGITATLIFVSLRIIQGLAIGGEIPGAITFVTEHIKNRPGLACSMIFLFINTGIILADVVHALITSHLSRAETSAYGWRIAFILGGILAIISYFLRTRLEETPAFIKEREITHKVPLYHLLRRHLPAVIAGILLTSLGASIVSILYLYIVSYLQTINHYPTDQVTTLTLAGLISFSLAIFIIGALSDYLGRKKLILLGSMLFIVFSLSFFKMIVSHYDYLLIWFILWGIISGLITGCFPCLLAEIFPVNVRYSGVAFCYNVGFAIFGGLSPLAASLLIHRTHNLSTPAWVLIATGIFSLIGLIIIQQSIKHHKIQTD
ncbi:MFS transporter [Piscirickettsia litoralis]|uniref:MFS transporter n=1 Tax=Piscirickettsia litoralis TaxID=1891921 RepID=UPI001F2090FB|nr:MFS transporter [Piscirickettsia litoralis]